MLSAADIYRQAIPPPIVFDDREFVVSDEFLTIVKSHGNIEHDSEDTLIRFYITTALQSIDGYQGGFSAYLTKIGIQQNFPRAKLDYPLMGPYFKTENFPVVDYRGADGNRVEIGIEDRFVNQKAGGFKIGVSEKVFSILCSLNVDHRRDDFVSIKYYAGISESLDTLPDDLKYAIALIVRRMYDYRDDTIRLDRTDISDGVSSILNRYRSKWIG